MNETIQQLLGMGPAIAAGATGNGSGMGAFMRGYTRAKARHDEEDRLRQRDALAQQDHQRVVTRQESQDRIAAEDRERRIAQEKIGVLPQLAEMGGAAGSPEEAQRIIETVMPELMKIYGQDTMGYGMPAVEMASRTITARQQRQVKEFLDAALKTSFVAENPDSDPVISNLPEHVSRAIGKPQAKLSELQQFAQLPVGRPQRPPSAEVSLQAKEVLVDGKPVLANFNPKTGEYSVGGQPVQASPIPPTPPQPRPTGPGGLSPVQGQTALKLQDDYARDSKPYLTMREAFQRVKSARPDAAGDLSLIFAYMKILDPNSVVREQEFANAQNAAGVPDRIRNMYNKVMQGTRLAPEQRQQFIAQADALFEGAKQNQRQVRATYGKRAKDWEIPDNMVIDGEDEYLSAPAPVAAPTFKVGQKIRNKRTGELGEVTGVRPDGSPIVRPIK